MRHRRQRTAMFVGAAVILLATAGRLAAAELSIPERNAGTASALPAIATRVVGNRA